MRSLIVVVMLLACYPKRQDNCAEHHEVTYALIRELLTDSTFLAEGSILPPSNKNVNNKPISLHIEIKDRYIQNMRSYINSDFKTDVIFDSCKTSNSIVSGVVLNNALITTDTAIYNNTSFHTMGTLTIVGIYVAKRGNSVRYYTDIIRRPSLRSKSQFNDVVEFTLKKGKWVKTGWKTYSMS